MNGSIGIKICLIQETRNIIQFLLGSFFEERVTVIHSIFESRKLNDLEYRYFKTPLLIVIHQQDDTVMV